MSGSFPLRTLISALLSPMLLATPAHAMALSACEAVFNDPQATSFTQVATARLSVQDVVIELVKMRLAIDEQEALGNRSQAKALYAAFRRAFEKARGDGFDLRDFDQLLAKARAGANFTDLKKEILEERGRHEAKRSLPWEKVGQYQGSSTVPRPNSTQMTTNRSGNDLMLEDFNGTNPKRYFKGMHRAIRSARFNHDGSLFLAFATGVSSATIWSLDKGGSTISSFELTGHTEQIYAVGLSPNGRDVATASQDGTVRVWNGLTGKVENVLTLSDAGAGSVDLAKTPTDVEFSADGRRVAAIGLDHIIKIWDLPSGRELVKLDIGRPRSITFAGAGTGPGTHMGAGAGTYLITTAHDHMVRVFDVTTGHELRSFEGQGPISVSSDGVHMLHLGKDGHEVQIREIATGNVVHTLVPPPRNSAEGLIPDVIQTASFSQDGTLVVAGMKSPTAYVWDTDSGNETAKLKHVVGPITVATFGPGDRFIITHSSESRIHVWEQLIP